LLSLVYQIAWWFLLYNCCTSDLSLKLLHGGGDILTHGFDVETLRGAHTLTELKVAARVLLEEDPSLTAARYALRMQEAKDLLDESIRQSNVGTKTYLDHLVARCRLDAEYIQTLQALGLLPHSLGAAVVEKYEFSSSVGMWTDATRTVDMFDNPKADAE